MEEGGSYFLNPIDESTTPEEDGRGDGGQQDAGTGSTKKGRGTLNGLFRAASIQDKLLEKLITQVIPADSGHGQVPDLAGGDMPAYAGERPGFSLPLMAGNFRRFNARIGVMFKFQKRAMRVLSWRRPTQTLSLLAVYTFICLNPYLIFPLTLAIFLFGVLVPSFIVRHPAPSAEPDRVRNLGYSPRGPPLAPARTVRPANEISGAFIRNMGDLQNIMADFSTAHDKVVELVVPMTNFSDETLSSAVFVCLSVACLVMLIAAHLLPLRFIALVLGWAAILNGHPAVERWVKQATLQYAEKKKAKDGEVKDNDKDRKEQPPWYTPSALLQTLLSDIQLDTSPETREVEVFELQHRAFPSYSPAHHSPSPSPSHPSSPPPLGSTTATTNNTTNTPNHPNTPTPLTTNRNTTTPPPSDTLDANEWQPWLFSPSPYDPLSAPRIAGERPRGTRFFEDVLPPRGWAWSEKKWALDLWSREWVEERIITGVEVETEGERWVYDIASPSSATTATTTSSGGGGDKEEGGAGGEKGRVVTTTTTTTTPGVSWEEGEEGMGRRGQWRRRRWVRMVKRELVSPELDIGDALHDTARHSYALVRRAYEEAGVNPADFSSLVSRDLKPLVPYAERKYAELPASVRRGLQELRNVRESMSHLGSPARLERTPSLTQEMPKSTDKLKEAPERIQASADRGMAAVNRKLENIRKPRVDMRRTSASFYADLVKAWRECCHTIRLVAR